MSFLDEIGSKLLQLKKKAKVAAKKPEFTQIEAKIVKFCTEPRVSSSIIELFPARPHNILGIVQSLVKRGILLACTNKYVANLEHRDFNVVMTMTANKKTADEYKEDLRLKFNPYYDAQDYVVYQLPFKGNTIEDVLAIKDKDVQELIHETLHYNDYVETSDGNVFSIGEIWEHTDEPERQRFRWDIPKKADTASDISDTWNNADDLQREDLLKAVNITSDYIRQYSAIDSFDLLPIWLQNALSYEKKASVLPMDETLWKNDIKDTVANLKADNITFKDALEMTDYLVGDKGDLTSEQKEYASQLYNESVNTVARKKKADEIPENLIFELNPKYWDVKKLVTDLKNKGIPFEVVERGSLRTDLIPATRKDYAEIYEDIYETDNYYKYFNETKQSPKKAEDDSFTYTIFDVAENLAENGYGGALIDVETDEIIDPYVDPSDHPDLEFTNWMGGTDITGKYFIEKHSGQLEEKFWEQQKVKKAELDPIAADELVLYIKNNGQLYERFFMPIIKNLSKKKKNNTYDSELAVKAFAYLAEEGAKKYAKDFGGTWNTMFDVPTRKQVATDFRDKFESLYENKEYDFMTASKQANESIDKSDVMITKTREGYLYEYRTPNDILLKQHYIGYDDKEEMMSDFLAYIKDQEENSGEIWEQTASKQASTTFERDDTVIDTTDETKGTGIILNVRDSGPITVLWQNTNLRQVILPKFQDRLKVIRNATDKQASAYTDFVGKYMKENKGSSIGDAAKAWSKQKGKSDGKDDKAKEPKTDVKDKSTKIKKDVKEDKKEIVKDIEKVEKKADNDDIKVIDVDDAQDSTEEQATNFYEYPSFMIFDDENKYLVAQYQLIIENGIKYIITDDVPTINKKLQDGSLNLNWEQDAYNFDIREKKADNEEEDFEEEFNEPEDGDYIMSPSGALGSMTSVGVVDGKFLGEFEDDDSAMIAIKEQMEKDKFWPNIWYVNDHGNVSLVTASKKQATGEADDYDTEFFDEIVNQLSASGFSANHKFFDAYQGPYLNVRGVDKFWIVEVYSRGTKSKEDVTKPYIKAILIGADGNTYSATRGDYFNLPADYVFEDNILVLTKQNGEQVEIENPKKSDLPDLLEVGSTFTYEKGTMTEVYVFTPENDPEIGIEVTNKNGIVDASDLVDYCKSVSGVEASVKKADSGYDFSVVNTDGFDESIINTLSPFGQVNYEEEEDGGAVLEIGVLGVPADKLIEFAKTVEALGASIWSVAIGNWGVFAENHDDLTPTEFVTQILGAKEASIKKADDEKTVTEVVNVPRKISPLEKTKDIPREEYIVAKEANDTLKDLYKSVMELSSQIATDEEEIKRVAAEMKKTKEIDPSKALLQESIEKLTKMLAESDKIVTINAEKVLKLVEKSSEEPVLSETVLAKLSEMQEKHRQIEDDYIKSAGAQMKEIKRTITQELKVIPLRANKTALSFKEIFSKIKNFFTSWMSEAKDFGKELDAITW